MLAKGNAYTFCMVRVYASDQLAPCYYCQLLWFQSQQKLVV